MSEKEEKKTKEAVEDFNKSKFRIKANEEDESSGYNAEDYGMCLSQRGWM